MEANKELQLLEFIENMVPPNVVPVTMIEEDDMLFPLIPVPEIVLNYFKRIDVRLDLDKNNCMHITAYKRLLDGYDIAPGGPIAIVFKEYTDEELKIN